MLTRFCWPNESASGGSCSLSVRFTILERLFHLLFNFILGMFQIGRPKGQLLPYGGGEKHMAGALKNVSKSASYLRDACFLGIAARNQNPARRRLQEAYGVFDEGGLARAIGAQHRNHITATNFQIDSLQNLGVGLVSEADMFEFHQGSWRCR